MDAHSEDQASALADACRLLAASTHLPTRALVESIADGSLTSSVRTLLPWLANDAETKERIAARLAACDESSDRVTLTSLRCDYTRLFSHPKTPLVPPCESLFKSMQRGEVEKPLLVVNRLALHLDQAYRARGYERTRGKTIPPDHLGTELEFLALLLPDRPDAAKAFIEQHLGTWAPSAFDRIEHYAETPTYALLGCLGTACFPS